MRQLSAPYLIVGCICAIVLGLTSALPSQSKALIGLSPNPPATAQPIDFGNIMTAEPTNGVKLMWVTLRWCDLEPLPGKYNTYLMSGTQTGLATLKKMGFTTALTLQTIDTNYRALPADLQTMPFNSPKVLARFDGLLKFMAKNMHSDVRWFMLGNEVDIYLSKHPSEVDQYVELVEHGRNTVRLLLPTQSIGVTTTHDGARDHAAMVAKLNRKMDVVSMTYYPVDAHFRVKPLSDLDGDFARMIGVAAGKPLFIQGFGCPADPRISSEDMQAAYVSGMFGQLAKYGDKVCGVNWFLLADFNDIVVNAMAQYYQQPTIEFKAYLSSLGLKRNDGTARKAWNVFRDLARNWAAAPTAPAGAKPVAKPLGQPTAKPLGQPTAKPLGQPVARPLGQPAMKPPVRHTR